MSAGSAEISAGVAALRALHRHDGAAEKYSWPVAGVPASADGDAHALPADPQRLPWVGR